MKLTADQFRQVLDWDRDIMARLNGERHHVVVPCNGCTACCQNDLVLVDEDWGDDPSQYETVSRIDPETGREVHALAKKDGKCFYLGEDGCTIWSRAPAVCQTFDCRAFYLRFMNNPRNLRRQMLKAGMASKEVLRAGKERANAP